MSTRMSPDGRKALMAAAIAARDSGGFPQRVGQMSPAARPVNDFVSLCTPETVVALLDDLDCAERDLVEVYAERVSPEATEEEFQRAMGDALRFVRHRARLQQRDLAERAGISKMTLHRMESGSHGSAMRNYKLVADVLEIDLADIIRIAESGLFIKPIGDSAAPSGD